MNQQLTPKKALDRFRSRKATYDICQNREFYVLYGGLMTTIVSHTYLAFRVRSSRKR